MRGQHEITRVETTDIELLRVREETRDRTCWNKVALLRVREETRDRTCRDNRYRTSQSTR